MNVILALGGYTLTVILVLIRTECMDALVQASVNFNNAPFSKLLAYLLNEAINARPVAKLPEA